MHIRQLLIVLWVGAFFGRAPAQTPPVPPVTGGARTVHAVRTGTPKIDGVMEAEWRQAEPADHFVQKQPVEGAPESLPTRAYVLYDEEALNVCFVCLDDPDSITARVLRRDNDDNCDGVYVTLDSFHDRRNAYYFGVTAAGGQVDGMITNETVADLSWEGIWESAVGRTDSGWVAEMRIPFSSFRHGGEREDGWGVNFLRGVDRRQEVAYWQPVNNQRGLRVGEFGILMGLENIGSSRHLEVLPHVVARFDAPADSNWKSKSEWEDLGLYAKYVPAASWTVDFAYQPDFAQVDVDYEVISLSNYPVFYPEKRPFFLEVGNFFDTAPIQLLYTRRITDPDFGGRIYGQSEKFQGMVLGGQNRTPEGDGEAVAAGRALWNIGKQSSVGSTATGLYRDRGSFHALTGGVDSRIRWGEENRWTIAAAGVERTAKIYTLYGDMGDVVEYNAQPFEFRNGLHLNLHPLPLKMNLDDFYRGQDYHINDLGWGDFSNTIQHSLWLGNVWQTKGSLLQQWILDLNAWQRSLPDGRYGEGGGQINFSFLTKSNYNLGVGKDWGFENRRKYEELDTSVVGRFRDNFFESHGRFDMDPHFYQGEWAWFETDERRWLSFTTEGSYGLYREGHKYIWNSSVTVKPRSNLETSMALDWTHVWGVDEEEFNYGQPATFRIARWVTRYSPTLNVSFRATLQYDKDALPDDYGNYSRDGLLTNLLLAYNWRPGSWFYLVYDETNRLAEPLAYRREGDRTMRAKLTYFFTVK